MLLSRLLEARRIPCAAPRTVADWTTRARAWRHPSTAGRRAVCTADEYRGPGGLTARELMAKIQEASERDSGKSLADAAAAGRAAADLAAAAAARGRAHKADASSTSSDDVMPLATLQAMSTHELVSLLVAKGADFSDCREHGALLERATTVLGPRSSTGSRHARGLPAYCKQKYVHVPASSLRGKAVSRGRDPADDL